MVTDTGFEMVAGIMESVATDVKPNWQPMWLVDTGHDCKCGITIDDHCFVVLTADVIGQWHPVKHIPHAVAQRIGQLAKRGLLDY